MTTTLLERVPCGVCGGADFEPLFEAADHIYGNVGRWPVARCKQCGVVLMNPRIPPDRIGPFYPKSYYTTTSSQNGRGRLRRSVANVLLRSVWGYTIDEHDPWWGRIMGYMLLPFMKRWSPATKYIRPVSAAEPRVLDVGCGGGGSLTGYKRLGWRTFGNEVSPDSAALARAAGHDVTIGEVRDAGYPSDYFDAITLWDALEHIHDPADTMRELHRLAKPGGTLHISIPNAGSWYWRTFKDKWFMFTAPLHYFHYTEETLRHLLVASGFVDVQITYPLGDAGIRPTLQAAAAGHRLWSNVLRGRLMNRILGLIEAVMPFGHLHAVAVKPATA